MGQIGNYKYTGKEKDATGLYYFGARYYDPAIGRFITRDPLPGSLRNPQSLNPYVYCLNNPLKYIDPDGRRPSKYDFTERDAPSRFDIFTLGGIISLILMGGGLATGHYYLATAGLIGKGASMILGDYQSDPERLYKEVDVWIEEHREYDVEDYRLDREFDEYGYLDYFLVTLTLKDGTEITLKIKHTFWGWKVDKNSLERKPNNGGSGSAPPGDDGDGPSLPEWMWDKENYPENYSGV